MAKASQPNRAAKVDKLEDQFVREYFAAGMNATVAYLRTYPGVTHDSARSSAAVVLARPSVKDKIAAHKRRLVKVAPVTGTDVIRELAKIAFADIGDVIDFRANPPALRPGTAIDPEARQAIAGLEIRVQPAAKPRGKPTVTAKVRMYDKLRALEKIGVMLGLWDEKTPAEKILEKLLATLPPAEAEALRLDLARRLGAGGGGGLPAAIGPAPGPAGPEDAGGNPAGGNPPDGGDGLPLGGPDAGPVAAEIPGGPPRPADGAGLPPGGQDGGVGGQDPAPLFDDP